jgi:hypothetical protein
MVDVTAMTHRWQCPHHADQYIDVARSTSIVNLCKSVQTQLLHVIVFAEC